MARPFNLKTTLDNADARAQAWADRGRDTAVKGHENAPRGGVNRNKYGEPRSAPGEPPAIEDGNLLRYLQQPVFREGTAWVFGVNYSHLETGTAQVAPRPLGRITLTDLQVRARRRMGP